MKKIAYTMSRFPKITETFILYEILELQKQGIEVSLFPILKEEDSVRHPEAEALMEKAHFYSPFSMRVLRAQLHWLMRKPLTYFKIWWYTFLGNLRSPKFMSRAIVTVPVAAAFAVTMEEMEIEHFHAHYATHPTLVAYVVNQLTGIPYSLTAHAHDIYVDRSMLKRKLEPASFVVAISDYNRRLLSDLYGSEIARKIKVVHCGTDPDIFTPREHPKQSDTFTMVCVGRLLEMKGQTYLVDACNILKERGVKFECLFVGDGEDREMLTEQIQRLGLQDEVKILGFQPRQQVKELLNQADVMLLPSVITSTGKMEGIPVALMEALATGIPVISTKISGIPELIEDGVSGLLVPERDAKQLAEAIYRLYDEPELREQFAEKGREKVLEEFNLITNSKALIDLFIEESGN